jgi:mannose-6-phosphate isomerase
MNLYPLVFQPRFVEKIWGGRKLQTFLDKVLPAGKSIGESWELFDFPPGVVEESGDWVSSVAVNGPLAGRSLHWLVSNFKTDLLGTVSPSKDGQFPILIKFLDAREDLSVQVHPDQTYTEENPGSHLKSEAWYVLQHDPDARLLKGLVSGTNRHKFAAAIATGEVEDHIQSIKVKTGDCFYLPSGTVHALGAGILVAEVQTPSDTTFRVFDFNRVDPSTGKLRQLHVEQALQCISFDGNTEPQQQRSHVAGPHTTVSRLVSSPYFTMEKVRFSEGVEQPVPFKEPVVWIMIEGTALVTVDGHPEPTRMKKGDTVLLPASLKNPVLKVLSDCVWLEVTFPTAAG